MDDFLCVGLLADYLLIRFPDVIVWEYKIVFNAKYFIIIGKITVLCSRNRSAMLTYIYIHTHTSSCLLEIESMPHTHTHAWSRALKHTFRGSPFFSSSRSASCTYTHNYLYWKFGWWQTHIHTPILTFDCLHKHAYISWYVPLSHLQKRFSYMHEHFTQLAYLFHQCGTNLLSRVGRIAHCYGGFGRRPGVDLPFSGMLGFAKMCFNYIYFSYFLVSQFVVVQRQLVFVNNFYSTYNLYIRKHNQWFEKCISVSYNTRPHFPQV